MRVLTEADLRTARLATGTQYHVPEGTYVTPLAMEFLRDRGIELIFDPAPAGVMSRTKIVKQGARTYVDAQTGEGYEKKPEEMTHLRGNLLVHKTHPRILLRGKLDTLQAQILLLQAKHSDREDLCRNLGEALEYVRGILGAEVKGEQFGDRKLFGYTPDQVREMSHHVKEHLGIEHPIPDHTMGETALELNLLRTQVREAELAAAAAFLEEDTFGIIKGLNRLSSGIYLLFCRMLTERRETR